MLERKDLPDLLGPYKKENNDSLLINPLKALIIKTFLSYHFNPILQFKFSLFIIKLFKSKILINIL